MLGCGVVSVSIWLWATQGPSMSVIPTYSFLSASSLCLITGLIILATGFLGCVGAFLENQCMLIGVRMIFKTYFIIGRNMVDIRGGTGCQN